MYKIWYCQKGRQGFSSKNSLTIADLIKLPDSNGYIKIGTRKISQIFRGACCAAQQISKYANGKRKSAWLIFCPIYTPITLSNEQLRKNNNPRQLKLKMTP